MLDWTPQRTYTNKTTRLRINLYLVGELWHTTQYIGTQLWNFSTKEGGKFTQIQRQWMLFMLKYFFKAKRDKAADWKACTCHTVFSIQLHLQKWPQHKKNHHSPINNRPLIEPNTTVGKHQENVTLKASHNKKAKLKLPFKAYGCPNKITILV